MILPNGSILTISFSIVDHICNVAYFEQVHVLRHLAEFESELLLCSIVEIGSEKCRLVSVCMLPGAFLKFCRRILAILHELCRVEDEKIDFTDYDQIC